MKNYKFFLNSVSGGHSFYITKFGKIMSFGKNNNFQTFQNNGSSHILKPKEVNLTKLCSKLKLQTVDLSKFSSPLKVKKISLGDWSSIILTECGRLFACGINTSGQLSLGHVTSLTNMEEIRFFQKKNLKVSNVFSGSSHSIFVVNDGTIYSSGDNTYGQLGINSNKSASLAKKMLFNYNVNTDVKDIKGGYCFTVLLLHNGDLYKCGEINEEGKVLIPTKINFPNSERIYVIGTGLFHIVAVGKDNCYGLGYQGLGQIGYGTKDASKSPQCINCMKNDRNNPIIDVECGREHTVFLKRNGECFGMGQTICFGCSDKASSNIYLISKNIEQIHCGRKFTIVIGRNGKVYVAGEEPLYLGMGKKVKREALHYNKWINDLGMFPNFKLIDEFRKKLFEKIIKENTFCDIILSCMY